MDKNKPSSSTGFTLIELIIVMVIISILTMLISGNFLNSLQKGRDARRKNDVTQIQRALEIYYEDYRRYPAAGGVPFGGQFCIGGCTGVGKVYMMNVPDDPNKTYHYQYMVDSDKGQYYYLLTCVENYVNDKGVNVSSKGYCSSPSGCTSADIMCTGCDTCKFYVGSPNAPVLVTPGP